MFRLFETPTELLPYLVFGPLEGDYSIYSYVWRYQLSTITLVRAPSTMLITKVTGPEFWRPVPATSHLSRSSGSGKYLVHTGDSLADNVARTLPHFGSLDHANKSFHLIVQQRQSILRPPQW